MSLKANALRAAVMKAISDALKAEVDAGRGELMAELLDLYDATGAKSLDVKVGDVKVASIPLSIPKAGIAVKDQAAFTAFVDSNYPQAVIVPPTSKQVAAAWQEAYLKECVIDGGEVIDPNTGEVVPGLEHKEAGRPKTFSIRFEKTGREAIAAAWQDGRLGELMPGIAPTAPLVLPEATDD